MEWIMYTVGIVAHLWALLVIIGLIIVGRDNVTNRINVSLGRVVAPFVLLIAYWNWFFFG